MAGELPPIVAILDANVTAFKARMAEVPAAAQTAMRKVEASTVQANAAFRQMEAASTRLAAAQKELADVQSREGVTADEVAAAQARVDAAQSAMATSTERAVLAYDRLDLAQTQYAKVAEESSAQYIAAQKASADAAESAAARQKAAAKAAADAQEAAAARMKSVKEALTGFADFGKMAAVAVGVVGYESVKMASNFDAAMERVHTQAKASQQEVDALKGSVLALAGPTAQSPMALADGLYHIESAGFRGQQALDMLHQAAIGATIGNANLGDVTQAMIATMASGIGGIHGATDAMAALNTTVGIGDMKMQQLAQSFSSGILNTAKTAGLQFQDVAAALATISDNATNPIEAATRLRMTFSMMAAPTDAAKKALAAIGIGQYQLANDMRQPNGLMLALTDLQNHLNALGNNNAAKDAAMNALTKAFGGGRSAGSIELLLGQLDRLKSKYNEMGTASKRAADLQEAWAATQQQFSTRWNQLKSSMESLMITIGNALIPVLAKLMGYLVDGIKWLTEHRQVAIALAVAVGSVLVAAIGAAVAAFVIANAEIIAIVAAIAAVAGAFTYLYQRSGALRQAVADVGKVWRQDILPALKTAWSYIVGQVRPAFDSLRKAIADNKPELQQAAHYVGLFLEAWLKTQGFLDGTLIKALGAVAGFIGGNLIRQIEAAVRVVSFLIDVWNTLPRAANTVLGAVRNAWDTSIKFIESVSQAGWHVLLTVFNAIWQAMIPVRIGVAVLQAAFQIAWAAIVYVARASWAAIQAVWNLIRAYVIGPLVAAFRLAQAVWTGVWASIKSVLGAAWGVIGPILGMVKTQGTDKVSSAAKTLQAVWSGVWASVKAVIADAWNVISGIASKIAGALSGILGVVGKITSAIGGIGSTVAGAIGNLPIPHAAGGPVYAGGTYLVGENGPEIITSSTTGYVIPNNAIGGFGGGGGAGQVLVPVTVMLDGQVLYRATQVQSLRHQYRNGINGLALV